MTTGSGLLRSTGVISAMTMLSRVLGLVRDMVANLGWAVSGQRVLVLGAGGAVRGVLAPLLRERPMRCIGMDDVARAAGVSAATVSHCRLRRGVLATADSAMGSARGWPEL